MTQNLDVEIPVNPPWIGTILRPINALIYRRASWAQHMPTILGLKLVQEGLSLEAIISVPPLLAFRGFWYVGTLNLLR